MKILVTGGAGFIGSALIKKLVEDDKNKIFCLDNYFSSTDLEFIDDVVYIPGSTNNISKLVKFKPDIIYHLGEYSRISTSFDEIQTVWKLNVEGTFRVLEFCRKNKCKLIYGGSSSKFGSSGQDENLSPYAWIKAKNVELIKNYGEWYGLEYAVAYFFNVYGEGQLSKGKYATVIGIFIDQLKNNKPLTVTSPGTQKRYFTNIKDVVEGLIKIGKNGKGDGYCLCDENSLYSIEEVAKTFSNNIVYLPEQKGNRVDPTVPFKKCQTELGWTTKIKLKDYINKLKKEIKNV